MMRVDYFDVGELVRGMMNNDDADSDEVEQYLWDKYEVSFDSFHKVIEALLPFTIPAKSALTEAMFHGSVKDGMFIVKSEQ